MKKTIFLVLICVFASHLNAQFNKGAILFGGGFDFDGTTMMTEDQPDTKTKRYGINVAPDISWAVYQSGLIGFGLDYGFDPYTSNNYKRRVHSLSLDLIHTQFVDLTDNLYLNFQTRISAGLRYEKEETTDIDRELYHMEGMYIRPGLTYFFSEKWTVSCTIGGLYYNHQTEIDPDTSADNIITQRYGLWANLNSFRIYFRYMLNND